jgi:hypothetical protein
MAGGWQEGGRGASMRRAARRRCARAWRRWRAHLSGEIRARYGRAHLSGETMKRIAQSRLADCGVPDNEHVGFGREQRLAAARSCRPRPHCRGIAAPHDRAVVRRKREREE